MCGRFTIISNQEVIEKRFRARFAHKDAYRPRYNAAPSQYLPVILNTDPEEIKMLKWGIRPPWVKKVLHKDALINIRAETLKEKHTFKADLEKRRCLVIADSFYEWKKEGDKKIPYRILLKSKMPFAFAGIWEINDAGEGDEERFAIITTEPNGLVRNIHHRMPVILESKDEGRWVDAGLPSRDALNTLKTLPEGLLTAYAVGALLNRTKVDNASLILPI